eukprot:TRINITY_DN12005_c0_g1_i1.p1 TRINITY_DN12005_c0_g1~~TRINITY_DN12005_c0_g1_i1.p1  ORF type:complete len:743 (+),score=141.41 TRINITY_DN12005_c0_g1_i1:115-2343(+)
MSSATTKEAISIAFQALDADHDGKIELADLQETLQMISKGTLTAAECKDLLNQIDTNHDGTIQLDEFITYVTGGHNSHTDELLSKDLESIRSQQHAFLDAARRYNWDEVRCMLDAQPYLLNVRPCGRWSALHQAAGQGKAEIVSWLLDLKADVGLMNRSNQTPLQVATGEAVKVLSGAPQQEVDSAAQQLAIEHELLDDAKFFRWEKVRNKIETEPKLINVQPCGRYSCLHQAIFGGNEEMVSFLLEHKADVTLVTRDGETALDLAEKMEKKEIYELLEKATPREACLHGARCGDFTAAHRHDYSHPVIWANNTFRKQAREQFGDGHWEVNMVHIRDESGWKPLQVSFEGDWALHTLKSGGSKDTVLHVSGIEAVLPQGWELDPPMQLCDVDMQDMCVSVRIKKMARAGMASEIGRFGLRRRGSTEHPSLEDGKHPFEKKLERENDVQKGFLTNELFWKTFCQAVEMGKDRLSVAEKQHYEKWLSSNLDENELFDYQYNSDWMGMSLTDAPIERRGGVLYRTPAGWKRVALNVWNKYDGGDNTWLGMEGKAGEWAVAYHGCAMAVVPLIMNGGFRVGTGQGAKNCSDTRTDKLVGDGVYCTPNIRVVECYANGNEDGASENKTDAVKVDGRTWYFAFQCRVRPEAINRPDRHFAHCNDEEVMGVDGVFEWIINSPDDIRPYAILVREKDGCEHRSLGQLIGNQAWNKSHKPLPFGSFDKIPGRLADVNEIQNSYLKAQQALL